MSLGALSWAAKQNIKSVQKLTLMMLANRHNGDTGQCNPSHSLLAQDCGLSDSGVRTAVRQLAALGLIKIISTSKNGVKLPNQYVLNTHLNITHDVGHEKTDGGSCGDRGWVTKKPTVGHVVTEGGSCGDDKTVSEPVIETVSEPVKNKTVRNQPKKTEKTFTEYEDDCLQNGVDLIPENSEPMVLAGKLGLDGEMMELFWDEFYAAHTDPASKSFTKKQTCWLKTISVYMRKNYFKIWDFDRATGEAYLTSTGKSLAKIRSAA